MHRPGEHLAGCGCRPCLALQSLAEKLLYQWAYAVALERAVQDQDIARAAVAAASLNTAQPGPSIQRAGGVAGQRDGRYKAMKRRKGSGGRTAVSVLASVKLWGWPAWKCGKGSVTQCGYQLGTLSEQGSPAPGVPLPTMASGALDIAHWCGGREMPT